MWGFFVNASESSDVIGGHVTLPLPHVFLTLVGLPRSINPQSAVASEYLERDPAKLYANLRPFRPYQLGYQDASPGSGIPLHRDFRHVPCNQYCGGGLVNPTHPIPTRGPSLASPQPWEASWFVCHVALSH